MQSTSAQQGKQSGFTSCEPKQAYKINKNKKMGLDNPGQPIEKMDQRQFAAKTPEEIQTQIVKTVQESEFAPFKIKNVLAILNDESIAKLTPDAVKALKNSPHAKQSPADLERMFVKLSDETKQALIIDNTFGDKGGLMLLATMKNPSVKGDTLGKLIEAKVANPNDLKLFVQELKPQDIAVLPAQAAEALVTGMLSLKTTYPTLYQGVINNLSFANKKYLVLDSKVSEEIKADIMKSLVNTKEFSEINQEQIKRTKPADPPVPEAPASATPEPETPPAEVKPEPPAAEEPKEAKPKAPEVASESLKGKTDAEKINLAFQAEKGEISGGKIKFQLGGMQRSFVYPGSKIRNQELQANLAAATTKQEVQKAVYTHLKIVVSHEKQVRAEKAKKYDESNAVLEQKLAELTKTVDVENPSAIESDKEKPKAALKDMSDEQLNTYGLKLSAESDPTALREFLQNCSEKDFQRIDAKTAEALINVRYKFEKKVFYDMIVKLSFETKKALIVKNTLGKNLSNVLYRTLTKEQKSEVKELVKAKTPTSGRESEVETKAQETAQTLDVQSTLDTMVKTEGFDMATWSKEDGYDQYNFKYKNTEGTFTVLKVEKDSVLLGATLHEEGKVIKGKDLKDALAKIKELIDTPQAEKLQATPERTAIERPIAPAATTPAAPPIAPATPSAPTPAPKASEPSGLGDDIDRAAANAAKMRAKLDTPGAGPDAHLNANREELQRKYLTPEGGLTEKGQQDLNAMNFVADNLPKSLEGKFRNTRNHAEQLRRELGFSTTPLNQKISAQSLIDKLKQPTPVVATEAPAPEPVSATTEVVQESEAKQTATRQEFAEAIGKNIVIAPELNTQFNQQMLAMELQKKGYSPKDQISITTVKESQFAFVRITINGETTKGGHVNMEGAFDKALKTLKSKDGKQWKIEASEPEKNPPFTIDITNTEIKNMEGLIRSTLAAKNYPSNSLVRVRTEEVGENKFAMISINNGKSFKGAAIDFNDALTKALKAIEKTTK